LMRQPHRPGNNAGHETRAAGETSE
jgi:hypothetical protein